MLAQSHQHLRGVSTEISASQRCKHRDISISEVLAQRYQHLRGVGTEISAQSHFRGVRKELTCCCRNAHDPTGTLHYQPQTFHPHGNNGDSGSQEFAGSLDTEQGPSDKEGLWSRGPEQSSHTEVLRPRFIRKIPKVELGSRLRYPTP